MNTPEENILTSTPRGGKAEAERERLQRAQEKRNAEAASQCFVVKDEKTQDVLSFEQGEVLPLKGGWFRVVDATNRQITLELVGFTGKTKKLAKRQAAAFKRWENAKTLTGKESAKRDYIAAGGKIAAFENHLEARDGKKSGEKTEILEAGKSEHVAVNEEKFECACDAPKGEGHFCLDEGEEELDDDVECAFCEELFIDCVCATFERSSND